VIHLVDEGEQGFVLVVEARRLSVVKDLLHQRFVLQQLRRDRGV
jgi:hypothetical protein